jgi:hypothetical protein
MALALGISKIEYGDPGDGVPGTTLTEITDNIAEGSVVFSFADPTEYKVMAEETDDPVYVQNHKEDVSYVEFALISPAAATLEDLAGGSTTGDKWEAPYSIPEIIQTVKITTKTVSGKYFEYTIVNGKLVCKLNQAPLKQQEEQLLVRVYIQAAVTAAGVEKTPFIREIITA